MKRPALQATVPPADEVGLTEALSGHDWTTLLERCEALLRRNPRHLRSHRLVGFALSKLHRDNEAMQAYERALEIHPEDAELLVNYGGVLLSLSKNGEAYPVMQKAARLRPDQAMVWVALARSCYPLLKYAEGFAAAEKAYALAKDDAQRVSALNQRAIHRRELGQTPEAVRDCEAAIRLAPLDPSNHTNRLLFMLSDPEATVQQMVDGAREFGRTFEAHARAHWPDFSNQRHGPWRRLKVGFLSADFRTHAVMYFVEGLLAQLDRRQFEVSAIYLEAHEDNVTERVRCHADHFIRLDNRTTQEQVDALRALQLDIAVDLSGHTGGNALMALAHKVAPLQVSWLGYPATTGLAAMDYRFTDDVTDPPDVDAQYTEQLFRLPTFFCCYRPMSREPLWRYQPSYDVQPTPALRNGYITFGSCNNLGKLSDDVLRLWGELLAQVPTAHLLIEGKNLDDPAVASRYRERCLRLGIDGTRLDLVGLKLSNQYLTYHRIDIALDPFPLTGGTTSCDVLWMGVPLVTLLGDSFKSRMSAGILAYLGRTEWIAGTREEYLRIARDLAADVAGLNAVRMALRPAFEDSVVMREDLFCSQFGHALRAIWLQWLAGAEAGNDGTAQMALMQHWLADQPVDWSNPPEPGVGLEPGQRVPLHDAHFQIHTLVSAAKAVAPNPRYPDGQIHDPIWIQITRMATTILTAVPHDAVALACLAEVEHAHGRTDFSMTYLRRAEQTLRHHLEKNLPGRDAAAT